MRLPTTAALLAALLGMPAAAQAPRDVRGARTFNAGDADAAHDTVRFLLGPEVVADPSDRTLRLARSVLLADEMGATDYKQTEPLSDRVHVKKLVRVASTDLKSAEVFFYGTAKRVHLNGKELSPPERLVSTGWGRVTLPPDLLKAGDNELVFSGGGSLLLEPGRAPGRSFKSADGGRTWSNDTLGKSGTDQGEYLVRVRLGRYAPSGVATSQAFDLWAERGEIGVPRTVQRFAALALKQPEGTSLAVRLRTGSTPVPDDKHWTAWQALDRDVTPDGKEQGHRWAQLRFELKTTKPQATPRVPATFKLLYDAKESPPAANLAAVPAAGKHDTTRGAVPFVYQAPTPRLKLLRDRYKLDEVIAPGKTEMEQLMLLRWWVRNQWHTAWGSHPTQWMPPWDAHIILESKDKDDCLTMCTHYAAVFTQCCLALGWNARHCILDHHCVAEVYVQQHDRWVMMDAGNSAQRADVGLHFECGGVPLSARELHLAHRDKKADGITVHFTPRKLAEKIAHLCRPAPAAKKPPPPRPDAVPLAELKNYPVCQLDNYRRYAFPPRNNFLDSLLPGELYQGWAEYFYDGYCWVGDSPDAPAVSPEYSRPLSPDRRQDVDWRLNWSRVYLSDTGKAGELRVDVETHTPNLLRLERRAGDRWVPTPATFVWRPQGGEDTLVVRSVNHWGKAGSEASVRVQR